MAKIKVVKVNSLEAIEKSAPIFKLMGVDISHMPTEQEIWIDTSYIAQVDSVLPDELSGGAFNVYVSYREQPLAISINDYDRLLNAWKEDKE